MGDGPIPQDAYVMLGGITLEDLRRVMSEVWDEVCQENGLKKPEKSKEMRATEQRSASLEHDSRQPRFAMEADVIEDMKTCEHTEGAAPAVQAKHGDSCSAKKVQAGPKSSTSFGDDSTELPTLPCSSDDALVGNGATAPKSCLSPLEMRTLTTAAGCLLHTDNSSAATRTIFQQLPLWFFLTKKMKSRTNQYAMDCSSFWKLKVL